MAAGRLRVEPAGVFSFVNPLRHNAAQTCHPVIAALAVRAASQAEITAADCTFAVPGMGEAGFHRASL